MISHISIPRMFSGSETCEFSTLLPGGWVDLVRLSPLMNLRLMLSRSPRLSTRLMQCWQMH